MKPLHLIHQVVMVHKIMYTKQIPPMGVLHTPGLLQGILMMIRKTTRMSDLVYGVRNDSAVVS